jgi:microcystin-dependent protein
MMNNTSNYIKVLLLILLLILNINSMKEDLSEGLSKEKEDEIYKIFNVDFNGINNLNKIAGDLLTQEKLTIPGNVDINGAISFLPKGSIIMYNNENIPSGWGICNGENGTPDLRNRFIVGLGGNYKLADKGGLDMVKLETPQLPPHNHPFNIVLGNAGNHSHTFNIRFGVRRIVHRWSGGGDTVVHEGVSNRTTSDSGNHSHTISVNVNNTGGDQPHENRPPYYALFYIMKLE